MTYFFIFSCVCGCVPKVGGNSNVTVSRHTQKEVGSRKGERIKRVDGKGL